MKLKESQDILFVSFLISGTDITGDGDDLFEGVDGEDLIDPSQARVDSSCRVSSNQDYTVNLSLCELWNPVSGDVVSKMGGSTEHAISERWLVKVVDGSSETELETEMSFFIVSGARPTNLDKAFVAESYVDSSDRQASAAAYRLLTSIPIRVLLRFEVGNSLHVGLALCSCGDQRNEFRKLISEFLDIVSIDLEEEERFMKFGERDTVRRTSGTLHCNI